VAKAYLIVFYRSIKNAERFAEYVKLAPPAIQAMGGRFLARGLPAQVYEGDGALNQRVVMIEFDSVEQAIAAHDGPAYQKALQVLGEGSVEREIRIIEGLA
jgi:uncharacterized protein (DUF1330 family)